MYGRKVRSQGNQETSPVKKVSSGVVSKNQKQRQMANQWPGCVRVTSSKMIKTENNAYIANAPKSPITELLELEPKTVKFGKAGQWPACRCQSGRLLQMRIKRNWSELLDSKVHGYKVRSQGNQETSPVEKVSSGVVLKTRNSDRWPTNGRGVSALPIIK